MSGSNNNVAAACVVGGVAAGLAVAHFIRPSWCDEKKVRPSSVTLSYFDGRGLGEVARQMLAVAGVEYNDKRYPLSIAEGDGPMMSRLSKPEMDADQAQGLFESNMGRLPILDVDGVKLGGSKAIYRYIANTYGLAGDSGLDAAQIDNICGMVGDISDAFGKQEDKDKWFNTSSAIGFKQGERQLQWYLESLDKCVGSDGFAFGGKFSMADAVIYSKFGEVCTTKGLFGSTNSEPMNDLARVQQALAQCAPNLAKIVQTFGGSDAIKAYLSVRNQNVPLF